jgi:hypothetical protein
MMKFSSQNSVQLKSSLKAINTSAGIYQLLLASEERMALRANINNDVFLGRASLNYVSTGAANSSLIVFGMDSLLHVSHLFPDV